MCWAEESRPAQEANPTLIKGHWDFERIVVFRETGWVTFLEDEGSHTAGGLLFISNGAFKRDEFVRHPVFLSGRKFCGDDLMI